MWPFRAKPLLDDDVVDWMIDHVHWLMSRQAHRAAYASAGPLPISDRIFPFDPRGGHDAAERLLLLVMQRMGVEGLPVVLEADASSGRYDPGLGGHRPVPRVTAAGTYRSIRDRIVITYDTTLLHRPAELVAVLAHEVSHAILDLGAETPPPSDAEEMLTDLSATFLGFGFYLMLFRYDTAIESPDVAREWRGYFEEYMSLRELCFATAMHSDLSGVERSIALRHAAGAVGPDAHPHMKRAFADLDRMPSRLAPLRALRMVSPPPLSHPG